MRFNHGDKTSIEFQDFKKMVDNLLDLFNVLTIDDFVLLFICTYYSHGNLRAISEKQSEFYYNNNAVFMGIMIIYGPRFFIYGPPVLFIKNTKSLFPSSQQTKFIRKKKKEDVTLPNSAAGKYIYGPPNFIYARSKDVNCATTSSNEL